MAVEMNNQSNDGGIDLYALPEDCIANALSLTNPRDACRLSLVSSTFRSAAQSDSVWERFLPAGYRDILIRSAQSFSLEKSSGKKCYMLAASDLTIVWGDTPCYWQWIPLSTSRFTELAELRRVCWLEIRGKIKTSMLSPATTYAAYLVFTLNSITYGFEDQPAEAEVGISGQEG